MTYNESISSRSFNYIFYDDLRGQYAQQQNEGNRNPIIDQVSIDAHEYSEESLAKIFFRSTTGEGETIKQRFPDLVPFSEKGFYSIFNSSSRDNEFILDLKSEEVDERNVMRRILRDEVDKIPEEHKSKFQNKLAYYQRFDISQSDSLIDVIHDEYVKKRISYYENYLDEMLEAKVSLINMKIDSADMTDSLECSYFIHPNMGEKGILCYFPLSSFSNGKHEVAIRLEREVGDDEDDSYAIKKRFPFVINRKMK